MFSYSLKLAEFPTLLVETKEKRCKKYKIIVCLEVYNNNYGNNNNIY